MASAGRRKYLLDYLFAFAAQAAFALRPLVFVPLIILALGKEAYGVWGQVIVSAALLGPFLTLKVGASLTRFLSGSRDAKAISASLSAAILMPILAGTVLLSAGYFLRDTIATVVFGTTEFADAVIPMLYYTAAQATFGVVKPYLLIVGKQRYHAILRAAWLAGEVVLAYVCIQLGVALPTVVMFLATWQLVLGLVIAVYAFSRHGLARPRLPRTRDFWMFCGWILTGHLVMFWAVYGSRYILVWLTDIGTVAVFSVVAALGNVLLLAAGPNSFALLPAISALWNAGRPDEARPLIGVAYKLLFLLGIPMLGGLYVYGNDIVGLLATKDFLVAAWMFPVMGLGRLASGVYLISHFAMWMKKRMHTCLLIEACGAVMNVSLAVLLIGPLGIAGAVIGFAVSQLLIATWMHWLSMNVFGVRADFRHIAACLGATVLMTLGLHAYGYVSLPPWLEVVTGIPLGAVLYGVLGLLLGAIPVRQLKLATEVLRQRFRRNDGPPAGAGEVPVDRSNEPG